MQPIPPQMPAQNCKVCGNIPEEDYLMQLCHGCRTRLANRPFPLWIKISAGVVCAVFIYAFSRLPSEIPAEIAFEKGKKAELVNDYAAAENDYKITVKAFPESTLAIARLGITEFRNHHIRDAAITLDALHDRQTTPELAREVNDVITQIEKTSP